MNADTHPEYEYIVVGLGAGGGPLAANLAKAGRNVWRVMLDMHMGSFPWRPDHAYE